MSRRRTLLVVLAPLVAVATLMIGLRVGAGEKFYAASVFVAPAGNPAHAGDPAPFAWQVLTYLEDRGVRETIGVRDLTVVARRNGAESRWTGSSNADGIAEAVLALPDTAGTVHVEVRSAGEAEPLASGDVEPVRAPRAREGEDAPSGGARPSKRAGEIGIDVFVENQRLVPGFESTLWIHVDPHGAPSSAIQLTAEPEAGVRLGKSDLTLSCNEWAELPVTAEAHVTGIQIDAKSNGTSGVWFGALPVAPGAFFVGASRWVAANEKSVAVLVAPNPREVVYAEVDDERGRVYAAALPLAKEAGDPIPRARLAIPELAPGLHWIVVSGEPRGAERLAGAAVAKPFLVGRAEGVDPESACSVGPWLARRPPTQGFPRALALDGVATRGAMNRARHRLGLAIGLGSLLLAALLEVLLLTAAAREAKAVMARAEAEAKAAAAAESEAERVVAEPPGGGLTIAILVALMGFALLAALMIAKG